MADELKIEIQKETVEVDKDKIVEKAEIKDPGQLEGLPKKKDPKVEQKNLEPGHPRFEKIYGELKEANRKIEALEKSGKEDSETMRLMKEHHSELIQTLEVSNAKIADSVKKPEVDPKIAIKEKISDLRTQRKEAKKDSDDEAIDRIDDEMIDLKVELKTLEKMPPKKEEKVPPKKDNALTTDQNKVFYKHIASNAWFNDPVNENIVYGIDAKFGKEDPDWYNKPWEDRVIKVKEEATKMIGISDNGDGKPKTPAVEGSTGIKPSGKSENKITLSPDEVKAAKGFGMTVEEWAAEKFKLKKLRGEI
jgi:hypothetical protein